MRFNIFLVILLGLFFFLQHRLWFEADGIIDMLHLKKMIKAQNDESNKLKSRNEKLVLQINSLHSNQDAIEARARNELGMIKKDETFYQLVK